MTSCRLSKAKESAEFLRDAWEQEQQMAREKRQAKKEAIIYKRWHNLITKALLRQRVADESVVWEWKAALNNNSRTIHVSFFHAIN